MRRKGREAAKPPAPSFRSGSGLQLGGDFAERTGNSGAKRSQGDDAGDRDERQDEPVLGEALPLFVGGASLQGGYLADRPILDALDDF